MNPKTYKKQNIIIKNLKKINDYSSFKMKDLIKLPKLSGVVELSFIKNNFFMINIDNDDGIVLSYLWRNYYEPFSLEIWFKLTRNNDIFFDIGAHTGIYTIIGNISKSINSIISVEPYPLNYARLLSNLRLNNISTKNCSLAAASNNENIDKLLVTTRSFYHSSGGKISERGDFHINKIKLDNFKFDKKVSGIKIDTEGHEFYVLEGAINIIEKYTPDIILEINENSFNKCINLLKKFNYNFYLIREKEKKFTKLKKFNHNLIEPEGVNCLISTKNLEQLQNLYI